MPVSGDAYSFSYAYSPTGNILTQSDPDSGGIVTNTYDSSNRLTVSEATAGLTTYTYDANGNQLTVEEPTGDITTNTWDYENRLVQVEHPDLSITTYCYDPDNQRVEKDDGVDVVKYIYDGNSILQERSDLGALEAAYTLIPKAFAHVVSQRRDGETSIYHHDGVKNIEIEC